MDSASQGDAASSAIGSSSDAAGQKKKKHVKKHAGQDGADDLADEKKSSEEALFSCMFALVKEKSEESWQYSYCKVILEGLVSLLIIFDPARYGWAINQGNSLWKIVEWANFSNPVAVIFGYKIYVYVLYALMASALTVLLGVVFLAWQMRKADRSKWIKSFAWTLQLLTDLIFNVLHMAILNFYLFMFSCNFTATPVMHSFFKDVQCLAMPHLATMMIAGLVSIIFIVATVVIQTAACELNPCAKGLLASPSASLKIKVSLAKSIFVISINLLVFTSMPQALLLCFLALYIFYQNFDMLPFFNPYISYIWCGMWLAVSYVTMIYATFAFASQGGQPAFQIQMTNAVVYGVWPVIVGGAFLTFIWRRLRMRHVALFQDPLVDRSQMKKIYRFHSIAEVMLLARAMRQFDLDGLIKPEAADLGELVIRAGLATYPNNPSLLILFSNFLMEVRKDGPASRTQLQTVAKSSPNLVQRFQAFCTAENSKRLKESDESQTMDLHSYVEFKRNYRAAMRTHKETLTQLREVWKLMLKSEPRAARIDEALSSLDASVDRSHRVYKRVLERYPKNGKLLKCYGRFLEDVMNDFKHAARAYAEATKQGGSSNGLLSMDFDFASQPGKHEMLLSLDINEDAVAIINAEGSLMLVSQGVTGLFGYSKGELENQNVSMLMPPPFSTRHASYLQRYKDGGAPRILESVKEVVAIHKDKHVFPLQICVTKLSGVGADAVFLGLMRPIPFSTRHVRCWITPTGTILCCGSMFSALTGIFPDDMVGLSFKSLVAEAESLEALLVKSQEATQEEIESGIMKLRVNLINKYTGYIPCDLHFTMGGTDQTRLFVVNLDRIDNVDDNLLVLNEEGNISFATIDLAVTLGYSMKNFLRLQLNDLLPAPINVMHEKHLRGAAPSFPVTSCRAGAVVFLVNSSGVQVPVRLLMSQREEPSGLKHVVKIFKETEEVFHKDRRIVITSGYDGIITNVEPETSIIFGFPSNILKGLSVCDIIDVFSNWRDQTGSSDMQLFFLALLDREHESPSSCWRVKLTPPEIKEGQVVTLPGINSHKRGLANTTLMRRQPKSAILQASLVERGRARLQRDASSVPQLEFSGDQGVNNSRPKIKLTLWRHELLVGTMELDMNLRVRRAGLIAGLIMGRSPEGMLRQNIYKFLEGVPKRATWDDLMGAKNKGSLKTSATVGKISSVKSFEGLSPDGGRMRVLLQGAVITDAIKGKQHVEICIKPDLSYNQGQVVDHSKMLKVLGMDFSSSLEDGQEQGGAAGKGGQNEDLKDSETGSSDDGLGSDEDKARKGAKPKAPPAQDVGSKPTAQSGGGKGAEKGGMGGDGGMVESWMKTQSKTSASQMTAPDPRSSIDSLSRPRSTRFSLEQVPIHSSNPPHTIAEEEKQPHGHKHWKKLIESMPDEANSIPKTRRRGPGGGGRKDRWKGNGDNGSDGGSEDDSDGDGSDGGSQTDGQSSLASSQYSHVEEILVDSRRNKMLNKLNRLFAGSELMRPVSRIKWGTVALVAAIAFMRMTCYLVLDSLIKTRYEVHYHVQDNSIACDRSRVVLVKARLGVYCRSLPPSSSLLQAPNCIQNKIPSVVYDSLLVNVKDMETAHQSVFLGQEMAGAVQKIPDPGTYNTWANVQPTLNYSLYLDTSPPMIAYEQRGLWELGNRIIAAAREVMTLILTSTSEQIMASRPYNFLHLNVADVALYGYERSLDRLMVYAHDQIQSLYNSAIILMVFEAILLIPLCTLGIYWLFRRAEGVRLLRMMLMAALPGHVLRTLVARPIKLQDDSDDEGEDDDDLLQEAKAANGVAENLPASPSSPTADGATGHLPANRRGSILGPSDVGIESEDEEKAAPVTFNASSVATTAIDLSTSKRRVIPTHKHALIFLLPLLAWFCIMVAVWAVTLVNLESMSGPIATLNMAMKVIYRFSQMRMTASLLVTSLTDAERDKWRAEMTAVIANITSEYNALLYGGTSITQDGMLFQAPCPAAAFSSPSLSNMFFNTKQCFRSDGACALPNSSWYEVTHQGLDVMMRRVMADMTLLAQESNNDLNIDNPLYETMYYVGISDLYDGLQTASDLFVSSSTNIYDNIKILQMVLVIAAFILALIYLLLVLRSYLSLQHHEVSQVAGLLSQVPNDVDMSSHVKRVMATEAAAKKRKGRGGKLKSSKSGKMLIEDQEEQQSTDNSERSSPLPMAKVHQLPF